jgi:hypothetical protein
MTSPVCYLKIPGKPELVKLLPGKRYQLGSDPSGVVVTGPGVESHHAVLENYDGAWFVHDLGTASGTWVNGMRAEGWVHVPPESLIRIGEIECRLIAETQPELPPSPPRSFTIIIGDYADRLKESWKSWLPSVALHILLIFVLARVVITATETKIADFQADDSSSGFFVSTAQRGEPPGGQAAAGPDAQDFASMAAEALPPQPSMLTAITTTTPSVLQFSLPVAAPAPSSTASVGIAPTGRGGGGSSYRSAGFGKGSNFGKGVGEWVGGGSNGIGISGRGKTLKTVNEFSVYFVIYSGDWYAALDTRKAPDSRQKEESPPGLPDEKNIKWYNWKPVPNTGPFVNYFWGIRDVRGGEDVRHSLVEFTPGAMGNLLRFVRQASAGNIKGAAKPAAVVLDKSLVPYTYDKVTKKMTWNAEGREKLRETLRNGLPKFTNFYGGAYGYIWNPKPWEPDHTDFTIEYLLDVRPMPPFIYLSGNDDFTFSDAEVDTLYQYLLRGGAIWGDCGFAGENSKFDVAFKREMKRVIPDEDKQFRPLKKKGDLFISGPDAYFDASDNFNELPYGMQYYDSPIEVIEMMPGLVSVVLTRNGYGNFLRFETAVVNNRFQIGGQLGRGIWASTMWKFREEFFRGLSEESIINSYKLGTNILVYMLGRWPAVLNRPENKWLLQ